MIDAQIKFFSTTVSDRVCQQPGLSLWVPFQNAATAVTNLYKGKDNLAALPIKGKVTLRQGLSPAFQLYWSPLPGPRLLECFLFLNPTISPERFAAWKLRWWSS